MYGYNKLLNVKKILYPIMIILGITNTSFSGVPSGGYVGYKVLHGPIFLDCVQSYTNNNLTPSYNTSINKLIIDCKNRNNENLSGYHMVLQLNNMNGGELLPSGCIIMAKVRINQLYTEPCPPIGKPNKMDLPSGNPFFEYFRTLDEKFAIDNQLSIFCCRTEMKNFGHYFVEIEFAIVPKPDWELPVIPQNEYAISIEPSEKLSSFVDNVFKPNITLKMQWYYYYDNCPEIQLGNDCPPEAHHKLFFQAQTYDPPNDEPTWPKKDEKGRVGIPFIHCP